MQQRNESGYLLFTVLIFMFVFTLLSASGLSVIQSSMKVKQAFVDRQQRLIQARKALATIQFTGSESCVIPQATYLTLQQQPLLWWWEHGCNYVSQDKKYLYVIEALEHDPCAMTSATTSAAYYRLTVVTTDKSILLQASFVHSEKSLEQCNSPMHAVTTGMQMWREL